MFLAGKILPRKFVLSVKIYGIIKFIDRQVVTIGLKM